MVRKPRKSLYEYYWLWLMDEVPALGSGVRSVRAKVGYKWVYIKREGKTRVKLAKAKWDALIPVPHCTLQDMGLSLAEFRHKVLNKELSL